VVLADPAAATPVAATVAARMRLVSYPAVKAWLLRCADKHHHVRARGLWLQAELGRCARSSLSLSLSLVYQTYGTDLSHFGALWSTLEQYLDFHHGGGGILLE